MSYAGFLVRIFGNNLNDSYTIPLRYIQEESYHGVISTLDKDAWRDGNGVLHRTAVLQIPHVTFTTRPLTNHEIGDLWRNIQSRYRTDYRIEKRVLATVYVSELDDYVQQLFYVPDIDPTIRQIKGNTIFYSPVQMELIGYGTAQEEETTNASS